MLHESLNLILKLLYLNEISDHFLFLHFKLSPLTHSLQVVFSILFLLVLPVVMVFDLVLLIKNHPLDMFILASLCPTTR